MVHQYQLNGYNIVLDTCSGAIHVVDEVAYDIIALYPDHTADEIVTAMMEKYLKDVKKTLLIEGNKTAQLGMIIRGNTGYKPDHLYLKYDSRPFVPSAILAKIKEVLS